MDTNTLSDLFSGILGAARKESDDAFFAIKDLPQIQEAIKALDDRRPDKFHLFLSYPLGKVVSGIIAHQLGRCQEVEFLLTHYGFVSNHVRNLVDKHEGFACGADKTRTIIAAALRYYADAKPIAFNYEGECTYHLPRIIFTDQRSILGFMSSLKNLYYGDPEKYLRELMEISQAVANHKASTEPGVNLG